MQKINTEAKRDFSVTLVSSAGGLLTAAGGEVNTLVNFTNQINLLNKNLYQGEWQMCLSSFYIHDEFELKEYDDSVKGYRVETDIINVWPNIFYKSLAIVPRKHKHKLSKLRGLYFEPPNPEYFPLLTTQCSAIQIQITPIDQYGNKIKGAELITGQPTVIKLHFKNTMYHDTTIKVLKIQSAESQSSYYAENTCVKFTVEAQTFLSLTPKQNVKYSVALNSISYLPEFNEGGKKGGKNIIALLNPNDYTKSIKEFTLPSLTNEEYQNPNNFLDYANNALGQLNSGLLLGPVVNEVSKVKLVSNAKFVLKAPIYLMFNLGLRDFEKPNIKIQKDDTMIIVLDPATGLTMDTNYKATAYTPEIGFIYCDFVEPSQVGNAMSPILGSFPIKDLNQNKYVTFATKNHEWYPLSKYDLSQMSFSLRDVTGDLLPFKNLKANLIISLLIKRRDF